MEVEYTHSMIKGALENWPRLVDIDGPEILICIRRDLDMARRKLNGAASEVARTLMIIGKEAKAYHAVTNREIGRLVCELLHILNVEGLI